MNRSRRGAFAYMAVFKMPLSGGLTRKSMIFIPCLIFSERKIKLLVADPGCFDHSRPALQLGGDVRTKLFWSTACRLGAQTRHALFHIRQSKNFIGLGI